MTFYLAMDIFSARTDFLMTRASVAFGIVVCFSIVSSSHCTHILSLCYLAFATHFGVLSVEVVELVSHVS